MDLNLGSALTSQIQRLLSEERLTTVHLVEQCLSQIEKRASFECNDIHRSINVQLLKYNWLAEIKSLFMSFSLPSGAPFFTQPIYFNPKRRPPQSIRGYCIDIYSQWSLDSRYPYGMFHTCHSHQFCEYSGRHSTCRCH
jgi:hypothetical protein